MLNSSSINDELTTNYRNDEFNRNHTHTNTNIIEDDILDVTTLCYGHKISLRGCLGKYLSSHYILSSESDNDTGLTNTNTNTNTNTHEFTSTNTTTNTNNATSKSSYILGIDGYGIGNISDDVTDCLCFAPIDNRDSLTMNLNSNINSVNNSNILGNNRDSSMMTTNNNNDDNNQPSMNYKSVIRYGQAVAIRAPGAKEKFLGKLMN